MIVSIDPNIYLKKKTKQFNKQKVIDCEISTVMAIIRFVFPPPSMLRSGGYFAPFLFSGTLSTQKQNTSFLVGTGTHSPLYSGSVHEELQLAT